MSEAEIHQCPGSDGPKKNYSCSCHCGQIKFSVDLLADDSKWLTGRCNCSICVKHGSLCVVPDVKSFKYIGAEPTTDQLGDYTFGKKIMHHRFCKNCGVYLFARGNIPQCGGDFIALQANVVDGVDLSKITKEKKYWNGKDDEWAKPSDSPIPPGEW